MRPACRASYNFGVAERFPKPAPITGAHQLGVLNWLAEAGPISAAEVAQRLLRTPAAPPARLVHKLVASLPRTCLDDDGRVRLDAPFWWDEPCVILDLETTGLDPDRASVIEVAAWRVRGDRVEDRLTTFVDPGHPIPSTAAEITGIDDSMVAGAPDWVDVVGRLHSFVGDAPWVAHNHPFDARFVRRGLQLAGLEDLEGPGICTLKLSRRTLSGGRHNLGACVERLGVAGAPAHRAEADVAATHQVLLGLLYGVPRECRSWTDLQWWLARGSRWLRRRRRELAGVG